MSINRTPFFIRTRSAELFAWFHEPSAGATKACAILLCPPLGYEYMSTHRSYRHLADALANAGFLVARIDYAGTGDSADPSAGGKPLDPYVNSVVDISALLRETHGVSEVCCLGYGLGGTFAMLAAERTSIEHLILWEPCIKGKKFVRQLKALSGVLSGRDSASHQVEALGIALTPEFEQDLLAIDLEQSQPTGTRSMLWLYREEMPKNASFSASLENKAERVEAIAYTGHDGFVDIPTDTVVPEGAIASIVDFMQQVGAAEKPVPLTGEIAKANENFKTVLTSQNYSEELVFFADQKHLFGVLTKPISSAASVKMPLVLFLNCGSEHHVGPHRIYTNFARSLSEAGYGCLRLDIEGIGDSVANGRNRDNYPYSPVAVNDVAAAIEFAEQLGYQQIILSGICAGAYHSFETCASLTDAGLIGAVMVNPLVYDWQEHQAAQQHATVQQFQDASRYKRVFFDRNAWVKLLKGGVNLGYIFSVFFGLFKRKLGGLFGAKVMGKESVVGAKLSKIINDKKVLHIPIAVGDPGHALLLADAQSQAARGQKLGLLHFHTIPDADHGMSKEYMREELFDIVKLALQDIRERAN